MPLEVATAKQYGYNLGIKLIRGAYMNEERELAQKGNYESPVWDTIEETHRCYNQNMELMIRNMTKQDMIFVASHNVDTVELAKKLVVERGLKSHDRVRFGQLRGFSD